MIGKAVSAVAGRSIARTLGLGAASNGLVPLVTALPFVARRVSPVGMVAFAVGGLVLRRLVVKHKARKAAEAAHASPGAHAKTGPVAR